MYALPLYVAFVGAIALGIILGGAFLLWAIWFFRPLIVTHDFSKGMNEEDLEKLLEEKGFSTTDEGAAFIAPEDYAGIAEIEREPVRTRDLREWINKRLPNVRKAR